MFGRLTHKEKFIIVVGLSHMIHSETGVDMLATHVDKTKEYFGKYGYVHDEEILSDIKVVAMKLILDVFS